MEGIGFFKESLEGVLELGSKVDSRVWGVSEIRTRGLLLFMGLFCRGLRFQGSTSVYRAEYLLGVWGFEQSLGVFGAET